MKVRKMLFMSTTVMHLKTGREKRPPNFRMHKKVFNIHLLKNKNHKAQKHDDKIRSHSLSIKIPWQQVVIINIEKTYQKCIINEISREELLVKKIDTVNK